MGSEEEEVEQAMLEWHTRPAGASSPGYCRKWPALYESARTAGLSEPIDMAAAVSQVRGAGVTQMRRTRMEWVKRQQWRILYANESLVRQHHQTRATLRDGRAPPDTKQRW